MIRNKQLSSKPASYAKGGSHAMAGKQTAGPARAGCTASNVQNPAKFAHGGNASMAGFTPASPAKPK